MKNLLRSLVMLGAMLLVVVSALFVITKARVLYAAQTSPFTVTQSQDSVDLSGKKMVMEERVIAITSSGVRVEKTYDMSRGWTTRRIFNPGAGTIQDVFDEAKVGSTVKLPPAEVIARLQRNLDPNTGCMAAMDGHSPIAVGTQTMLGDDVILGIPVKKVKLTNPHGDSYTIMSLAPSLGCISLYSQQYIPSKGTATVTTTSVERTEPDAALYAVGADLSETNYSGAFAKRLNFSLEKMAATVDKPTVKGLANRDKFYDAHRP
jgi:hypothetical protein